MKDITVIYLTANLHPEFFTNYQREVLLKAIGDTPLISVSRKPIRFGFNIIDSAPQSHLNMYRQLLTAVKLADTPYIASAEDDVLYSKEHFSFFRPPMDTITYDMSRWSLYTWNPMFSIKQRISNCTLIAPREEYIDALSERLEKLTEDRPELVSEVGRYEKNIGVRPRKIEKVYCPHASVQINHPNGTDSTEHRKRLGQIKAIEIPEWGRAEDIIRLYR